MNLATAADTRPHVIVIGAGFGGLSAARALGSQPVRVTVYDRLNYHLFQPLLYQVALGALAEADIAVPIRSVVRRQQNVEVQLGELVDIDPGKRRIRLRDGMTDDYDYLIVAAGARTNYYGNPEWAEAAPGLKDLDDALVIRRRVLLAFEAAERARATSERDRLLTFVVIGGGATGVELAGAIADLSRDILHGEFRHLRNQQARVVLLEMADRVLAPFEPELSTSAAEQLRGLGVEVRTNTKVSRIDERGVWLGEENIPAATVLWGAGVAPSPVAKSVGAELDRAGRVLVADDCSVPGHPEVFVIGDMAAFIPRGEKQALPGVSPVAIQQGRAVAANILRERRGQPRKPFVYRDKGMMATIGRGHAVAQVGSWKASGRIAWLAWGLVHIWYLIGFRNRLTVFVNWVWAYFMSRPGARVVTGPSEVRSKDLSAVTDARRPDAASPAAALGPQSRPGSARADVSRPDGKPCVPSP